MSNSIKFTNNQGFIKIHLKILQEQILDNVQTKGNSSLLVDTRIKLRKNLQCQRRKSEMALNPSQLGSENIKNLLKYVKF